MTKPSFSLRRTLAAVGLAVACTAHAQDPTARQSLYIGASGGLASGSVVARDGGSELALAGKASDATFSLFGGVRLPLAPSASVAIEADYLVGEVGVAEASSGALQANAALRNQWTLSVLPTWHVDDRVGLYLRLGAGRGELRGSATDGTVTIRGSEHYTLLRGGVGINYAVLPGVLLRFEYVFVQAVEKDGIQPSTSGAQIGAAFAF